MITKASYPLYGKRDGEVSLEFIDVEEKLLSCIPETNIWFRVSLKRGQVAVGKYQPRFASRAELIMRPWEDNLDPLKDGTP